MAKSAEKINPAKRQGKTARKPNTRTKKPTASTKFMLDSMAAPLDPALIAAKPSMPSLRPAPVRKRKSAAAKSRTTKAKQQQSTPVVATPSFTVNASAPLPRSNAMVVWQKSGPTDQIFRWLRLSGRAVLRALTNPPPNNPPPAGVKLRTKNDLLRELAILREENAIMRQRLGLPQMPFGRQILDCI